MSSNNGVPASHELANAVEAAINLLYLIRVERNDPDKVLELADLAEAQLDRMVKVISGLSR